MSYKTLLLMVNFMFMTSCQTPTQQLALLVYQGSGQEERQLLQESISRMLNTNGVILSDSAFTDSSDVIVERGSQRRSLSINSTLGRNYGAPDHIRLWLQEGSCLLEHIESGNTMVLKQLRCVALESL